MTVPVYHAVGGVLQRKGRPSLITSGAFGPVSVTDVNQFESLGLGTPIDANYVPWTWPTGTDLWSVFQSLGANDILVLPEDENPYVVNQMYRTADGTANGANPTTDRAACRSKKGIFGLGPNAVIAPAAGFPTYAAQTGNEGVRESLVENVTTGSYHANFTIKGRNVGGLAYHALKLDGSDGGFASPTVERIRTVNHYGFQNFQPGEAMGILAQFHTGTATIRRCEVDGRNPTTGVKEGSGGIHLVQGAAALIDACYVHGVRGHGIAHYWRLGATTIQSSLIQDVGTAAVHGNGINVEISGTNSITLNDCTIRMGSAASGNVGAHFAVVSVDTGSVGAYGATQIYANNLTHDEATVQAWRGPGTYAGVPNIATDADFHFSPARPVTYSSFLG